MPIYPANSGFISTAETTATPPTTTTNPYDTAYAPQPKKYQYWAVKVMPYVETQLLATSTIQIGQIASIDLTFNLEDFKSYIWADAALWYQFDSTDPLNILATNVVDTGAVHENTNYKNYFLCSDAGITVKPILMSINIQITLTNCYKTLIQSLTDWSNWTKIGPTTPYYGLLDTCQASDSESVTVFSWNPVASDYNYLFYGNTGNGNPQTDWDATETSTTVAGATNHYKFNYCAQVVGNEYELNNGGMNGDLYCGATATDVWASSTSATAYAYPAAIDKTIHASACK